MLALALLVAGGTTWYIANDQAYRFVDNETDDALGGFTFELTEDTNELVAIGKWLATQRGIVDLVNSPNPALAAKTLEPLQAMRGLDFFIITDAHGIVVAQDGAGQAGRLGQDISQWPEVRDALVNRDSLHTQEDVTGQLATTLTLPLYDLSQSQSSQQVQNGPIGVLMAGFFINEDYLKHVRKKFGFDMALTIISKDRLAASTLAERGGTPSISQLLTAGGDKQITTGRLVTLMTNHGPYLYKFQSLPSPANPGSILIGSGMPVSYLDDVHTGWLQTFGVWVLAGLATLVVAGFLMARNLVSPVKRLTTSVQEMARGELASRTNLWRDDEFGDLATQLDEMRRGLRQELGALAFEKERTHEALQSISVPVVVTDASHQIVSANRAAEILLSQKREHLIGQSWQKFFAITEEIDSASLPAWQRASQLASPDQSLIVRGRLALNAESEIVLDITSVPIRVEGELVGYVHTLQDVSELDKFARAKNEFLLSVAHELETPLTSWRASVELLMEDYAEMSRHDLGVMLRNLQKGAVRFQSLVETLVDIGRLEAGKFRVRPSANLCHRLIRDSLSQVEPSLHIKGQSLEVMLDVPPDCQVLADRSRITQVVINLLRNASKYSPEGSQITLSARRENGFVYIEVTDQGMGIDPEEQEAIFKRYYRSKHVQDEGAGIGLGLGVARAIVEAHGGQIGVRSEFGNGATFWFSLAEVKEGSNGAHRVRVGGTGETSIS